MTKQYTLHSWHGPAPEPTPIIRRHRRLHQRGPIIEEMVQRDGAWPEFIAFVPRPSHTRLHPDVKKARAEARAKAKALTPEQLVERKKKTNAQALAHYHANKDKLLPVMRARAKVQYAKMTPEQRATRVTSNRARLKADPERVRKYNNTYNKKKKAPTVVNHNN